jgi:hypothetical protein
MNDIAIGKLQKGDIFSGIIYEGDNIGEVRSILKALPKGKVISIPGANKRIRIISCVHRDCLVGIHRGYKIKIEGEVL